MKKLFLLVFCFFFSAGTLFADYDSSLNENPIFMEDVYSFINSPDITDGYVLGYCEQVYLEATRRREYTQNELNLCGDYFTQKNNEEKAYMIYMFNNREYFY